MTNPQHDVATWRQDFCRRHLRFPTHREMLEVIPAEVVEAFEAEVSARLAARVKGEMAAAARRGAFVQELSEARKAELLDQSEIPPRYRETTFAALDDRSLSAKNDAKSYCANGFEIHGRECLLLMGPPGTGKTALAVACLRQALDDRPEPIRFAHIGHYLEQLRAQQVQSIQELTSGYQLVALDEIGRQRLTEWGQEQVHLLVDGLYAQRRRAVLTTNLTWRQWTDSIDEAIRSRCREMCQVVTLAGGDRRLGGEVAKTWPDTTPDG